MPLVQSGVVVKLNNVTYAFDLDHQLLEHEEIENFGIEGEFRKGRIWMGE